MSAVTDVNIDFLETSSLMSSTSPPPAASNSAADPFYHFKSSLEEKIAVLENATTVFVGMVKTTDTASNPEYASGKKKLKKLTKVCEATLRDLSDSLRVVSNDRAAFDHINDDEFNDRTNFVNDMNKTLAKIKSDCNSDSVQRKVLQDERNAAQARGGNLGATDKYEQKNTDFIYDQQASAQVMMRQQDETLEDLGGAVDRVGNIAVTINEELAYQNKALDELATDLDDAEEKLGVVMGKLGKLLKTKDGCQLWTIVSLFLVLVVLCALVFYLP
jgi:syntaxin 6